MADKNPVTLAKKFFHRIDPMNSRPPMIPFTKGYPEMNSNPEIKSIFFPGRFYFIWVLDSK
jgi:hypothetical protein